SLLASSPSFPSPISGKSCAGTTRRASPVFVSRFFSSFTSGSRLKKSCRTHSAWERIEPKLNRHNPRRRFSMQRKASAVWQGDLKTGKGAISTDSGVLKQTQYSFSTRFENGVGTNPEELLAAAHAG